MRDRINLEQQEIWQCVAYKIAKHEMRNKERRRKVQRS